MELNYYTLLIKKLNQIYSRLRMETDLPWTNKGIKFLKSYLNLNNLSEVEQLQLELQKVDNNLKEGLQVYNFDLVNTFNQQYRDFLILSKMITTMFEEFKSWTIPYNDQNFLQFKNELLITFQSGIEFFRLNDQQLFLEYNQIPLFQYLSMVNDRVVDKTLTAETTIELMSEFYYKINNFLREFEQKITIFNEKEALFIENIQKFSVKINFLMFLYYNWLNTNQIIDENTSKFASFYL